MLYEGGQRKGESVCVCCWQKYCMGKGEGEECWLWEYCIGEKEGRERKRRRRRRRRRAAGGLLLEGCC